MKSVDKKEPQYKNCYIAFIDILGFKDLVCNRLKCKELSDIFEFMGNDSLESSVSFGNDDLNFPLNDVKKYIMSDSIILYIEDNKKNALGALLKQTQFIQAMLIQREYPIIVSGGIASGELYRKQSYIFGPGIVEAYRIQNLEPHYPRVVVEQQLASSYLNKNIEKERSIIKDIIFTEKRDYSGTLQESNNEVYAVDYLRRVSEEKVTESVNELIDRLCKDEDCKVKKKYDYILNYFHQRK